MSTTSPKRGAPHGGFVSERDQDPTVVLHSKVQLEAKRKQERLEAEMRRREAIQRVNQRRAGHDAFVSLLEVAQRRFETLEAERSLIQRSAGYLGDRIERKDHPHVLIISDHPLRLAFYTELLRMVGCRVDATRMLSHGVTLAAPLINRSADTDYDIIIVDRPRAAATDAEAAQLLQDFTYSVRIRDAVYRKENFSTVSNKFVFVLGETDIMAQFLVQTGAVEGQDTLCVRRPLYFHLKRIRQLVLPVFVSSQVRLRIYRTDPNFEKIQRLLKPAVSEGKHKSRRDDHDAEARDGAEAETNAGSMEATGDDRTSKKQFVTFESLMEENDHLHNVVLTHLRTKVRLEEQIKQSEAAWTEKESRYQFSIQGLEGQLRDRERDINEVMNLAKDLRTKLHEMQVKELQWSQQQQQLIASAKKTKKKDQATAAASGEAPASDPSMPNPTPGTPTTSGTFISYSTPPSPSQAIGTTTVALGAQLDVLMNKQKDAAVKRDLMIAAVRTQDAQLAIEAKLHAVEVNSKPIQCDIWFQSPQEQLEMAKAFSSAMNPTKTKKITSSKRLKPASQAVPDEPFSSKPPTGPSDPFAQDSRSQSRQPSRAQSRAGSVSRASSNMSSEAEDEVFGGGASYGMGQLIGGTVDFFSGGDHTDVLTNLRVENSALKKQLQYLKVTRSLSIAGGMNNGVPVQGLRATEVAMPSADQMVADGTPNLAFLHRKIADLSSQVSRLEGALAAAGTSASPVNTNVGPFNSPDTEKLPLDGSGCFTPPEGLALSNYSMTSPPPDISTMRRRSSDASGGEKSPIKSPLRNNHVVHPPAAFQQQQQQHEIMRLRETVSRLEYKVHTQDLYRITTTMQKLMYKGAMMRLLTGGGGGQQEAPRKKWTKETGVNTILEGMGEKAALWDQTNGSLFSPKEMEQRIAELGMKLKDSNIMFKEAREQHLSSERKTLEMKLELEKMHATQLETSNTLLTTKRQLTAAEETVKAFREKCANLDKLVDDLKQDVESKAASIAILKQKPITNAVGSQTKVTGDISKKGKSGPAEQGNVQDDADAAVADVTHDNRPPSLMSADAYASMNDALTAYTLQSPSSQPMSSPGGTASPQSSRKPPLATPPPTADAFPASWSPDGTLTRRGDLQSAGTVDSSSALDGVETTVSQLAAAAVASAPTDDEIQFLVTTRMAALALYSAAQVDGSDVPRKEHDAVVNRLKKECADYVNTIKRLNEVRNLQRVEVNELRVMYKDMKDSKNSVPELKASIEQLTNQLAEETQLAAKRERLMRKDVEMMRLKYAHDDDIVAMAAFDVESFSTHTLKAPLDGNNDRSIRYLCRGVEYVLGAARRLIVQTSNYQKHLFIDASQQTVTFMDQNGRVVGAPSDNGQTGSSAGLNSEKESALSALKGVAGQRARRRVSVSIVETAPQQKGPAPSGTFATPIATSSSMRRRQGLVVGASPDGGEDGNEPTVAMLREFLDAEMQTVDLLPLVDDASIQCTLEASLPPRKSLVPPNQRARQKSMAPSSVASASLNAPVLPQQDASPKSVSAPALPSDNEPVLQLQALAPESPTNLDAKSVPYSSLPDEGSTTVMHRGSTPQQRSSLLNTPGGTRVHSSRLQHRRAFPSQDENEDALPYGSNPSSANFADDYESVPLVETKEMVTQTDVSGEAAQMLEWLGQLQDIHRLLRQAAKQLPDEQQQQQHQTTAFLPNTAFVDESSTSDMPASVMHSKEYIMLVNAVRSALVELLEERASFACESCWNGDGGGDSDMGNRSTSVVGGMGVRDSFLQIPKLSFASADGTSIANTPRKSQSSRMASGRLSSSVLPMMSARGFSMISRSLDSHMATQTDPVNILPDPQHPPLEHNHKGFSIFHGEFHQESTLLPPPLTDVDIAKRSVGTQCNHKRNQRNDSDQEGNSENDSNPLAAQMHVTIPCGEDSFDSGALETDDSIAAEDASRPLSSPLQTPQVSVEKKRKRNRKAMAAITVDAFAQTEPDANPSKLSGAFVVFHQAFHKLVAKLRSPLCLTAAQTNALDHTTTSLYASPQSVKLAVEAATRNCNMIELILEKLAVATRGLRNCGLHGVDLTVATLGVLVDDKDHQLHRVDDQLNAVAGMSNFHRHIPPPMTDVLHLHHKMGGGSGAMSSSSPISMVQKKLPPISPPTATVIGATCEPSSSGANITIQVTSQEGCVALPPIRTLDEVLLAVDAGERGGGGSFLNSSHGSNISSTTRPDHRHKAGRNASRGGASPLIEKNVEGPSGRSLSLRPPKSQAGHTKDASAAAYR